MARERPAGGVRRAGWPLVAALLGAASVPAADNPSRNAIVRPDVPLAFPRDHGSHPQFRTEWWYVTGWLETSGKETLGFQVTFFRTRLQVDAANPSAFTPRQLIIAHAAISDSRHGRLRKDQRIARANLGLAGASEIRTRVWLDRWHLTQDGPRYTTRIEAEDFAFDLALQSTQPPLANGREGFSQKGPDARSASHYYSWPQLAVSGEVVRAGKRDTVTGRAWLDHEWSSEYLDADASGWDWVGVNLDDGGALMAFRIRDVRGTQRWAGGTWRSAAGAVRSFAPAEIEFVPGRRWRSPRTGYAYPVEWQVRAGDLEIALRPLMDDQESDARMSTGAIYWEGAVTALRAGGRIGRGYLELTGYGEPLRLP